MKFKNQKDVIHALNPFLGFGWYTGINNQNKKLAIENNYIASKKRETKNHF